MIIGTVCKTDIREFDSHRGLHFWVRRQGRVPFNIA